MNIVPSLRGTLAIAIALTAFPLASADDASLRSVQVTDSDGKTRMGILTELAAGQLALAGTDPVKLKTRNLLLLKYKDRTVSTAAGDPLVILSGGDVLAIRVETINDESLAGRWNHDPERPVVKVPLESVRAVIFERPANASAFARLLDLALDGAEPHDSVILSNGDALVGEFGGLDASQLLLTTPAGRSAIDRRGLRAIVFNPALTNGEALRGEGAIVALTDGSRFRARDLKTLPADDLFVHPQFGGELSIPLGGIESLRFLGGCATYLSDLTPSEYKFEPFFDLDWPLRRDRSVSGTFLKLRGVEYPKGLGMHSRSTVVYRLDHQYREFRATIGMDDVTAGKGNAVFEVLADGKVVYSSGSLTGKSQEVHIDHVNVTGARSLSLRVDFGEEGDILDHADWCDAVLIK